MLGAQLPLFQENPYGRRARAAPHTRCPRRFRSSGGTRRRGAPLLRPLARLTSFGGYVATPFSVERELDPPVAMAPSPSHRGKAPYGTRRRGAPLLRPLARLTSFGGYVATPFSVAQELDPPVAGRHGDKATNYHLLYTNYIPKRSPDRVNATIGRVNATSS